MTNDSTPAPAPAPNDTQLPANFRWKAFAVHLAISLAVLAVLLWILFRYWFPDYLFDTDGGWQALRVIAGVDVVLGPLLTLIVANAAKPRQELRRDFAIIGLIQVAALSLGTWLAWDNRPYALLWYDGMVYSLPWSSLSDEASALAGIRETGKGHPARAVVSMPFEPIARSTLFATLREDGRTPLFDGNLYREWPPNAETLAAFNTLALEMSPPESASLLQDALAAKSGAPGRAALVPVRSRYSTYFLAVDMTSGEILQDIRVPPDERLLNGGYPLARLGEILGETVFREGPGRQGATMAPVAPSNPAGQP